MSDRIECRAVRRGRTWVVHVPDYQVYGSGRTLKTARENAEEGLALLGVTAALTITPESPELEDLRLARAAYEAALAKAVTVLTAHQATLGDIALATRVTPREVKRVLAECSGPSNEPNHTDATLPPPAAPQPGGASAAVTWTTPFA